MLFKNISFLFLATLYGQLLWSQTDAVHNLSTETQNARSISKIFVHTDKESYVAGDILWFKIYRETTANNMGGKVAYVEVIDEKNTPLSRMKISIQDGSGSGSLQIPLSFNTGYYKLRAYTAEMAAAGAESFFEKQLRVINTLKQPGAVEAGMTTSYRVGLFPEGGHLVAGLPSRVAFRVSDADGKGMNGTGYLLNSNGDTISTFRPVRYGMGSFQFTPSGGEKYRLVYRLPDNTLTVQELPAVEPNGFVLSVEEADASRLKITVTSRGNTEPEVYLLSQSHNRVTDAQRLILQNNIGSVYFNKSQLAEGVTQFTLFDSQKIPVCERLVFKQPKKASSATLKTDLAQYDTRSKVSLTAATENPSDLSLSVFRKDGLQENVQKITQYYWLTSELTGSVEDADYYFSDAADVNKVADILMMTSGWRNFRSTINTAAETETAGQIIKVLVSNAEKQKPVAGVPVFLSIPATAYKLYSTTSDSTGMAVFTIPDFYGHAEVILQTRFPRDAGQQLRILNPFAESYTSAPFRSVKLNASEQKLLEDYSINMQVQHLYSPDSLTRFYAPAVSDTFPFYGEPLYRYHLDDYKRFTTMEEVLREYVREINVGVKGSGEELRIKLFNEETRQLFTDDILVTVDGVPLQNPNKVFSVDPLKIKDLDIITRNFVLGPAVFRAVANFSSYNGDFKDIGIDPGGVVVDYEGLQLRRQFYAPEYAVADSKDSRIPDFRTTLYWNPDLSSGKSEFFTGDNKGTFEAVLQGLDKNGRPVFANTTFTVK